METVNMSNQVNNLISNINSMTINIYLLRCILGGPHVNGGLMCKFDKE